MNRLEYWLKADTQYRVHSPFVFDMYRKVLFATLPRSLAGEMAETHGHRCRRYHELVYKLQDHYCLDTLCYDDDEAVLQGPDAFGSIKVVCRPHASRPRELRWRAQQDNDKYRVSIDLYDVGLLLSNPRLSPQHFILK